MKVASTVRRGAVGKGPVIWNLAGGLPYYDLPAEFAGRIHVVAQAIALAMKSTYGCEGVSTRQHNEPAGNQDVWHYHLHIFPRYAGDELYLNTHRRERLPAEERATYAVRLRAALTVPKET